MLESLEKIEFQDCKFLKNFVINFQQNNLKKNLFAICKIL